MKLFGGVNEIGGNKFLVEDSGTRIFLDFGLSYAVRGKYFEEYLKPSPCAGMAHLIRTGLLPSPLDPDFGGCYRSDYLGMMGLQPPEEPAVHGAFISHIHYDHSAYAAFLHEEIPLYGSPETIVMAKALSECGQRDFENEIYEFKRRPCQRGDRTPLIPRQWSPVRPYSSVRVDGVEVMGLPVDHSVPGALAYLVHTSEGTILYTGDLRVEGYGPLSIQSLERLEGESIDLMLCEGTRIQEPSKPTDEDVAVEAAARISEAKGMVIADFAYKDLRRLTTFLAVARRTNRGLTLTLRDAHILRAMRTVDRALPDPIRDPDIEVMLERKISGSYDRKDYDRWERDYLNTTNVVRSIDLATGADRRILHAGFYDMTTLLDFELPPGSIYIHSASEPHNEEQAIDDKRLTSWLDLFRTPKFHIHASGHASFGELRHLVEATRPQRVVPIHTEHPDLFAQLHQDIVLPEYGKPIAI